MNPMRRIAVAALTTGLLLPLAAAAAGDAAQKYEDFDRNRFGRSTTIDNPWLPLVPGTRFVYEGTTVEDDGERLPHRVEIHVTDLTKVIDGVRAVATWDLDYADGELVEAELAFFAQDDDGTVWRVGEHPEEYDEGEIIDNPSWFAGIDGARAGIEMLAEPRVGVGYSQGWDPGVGFTDRGQVEQLDASAQVPAGSYEGVLVIVETSEDEGPDAAQLKYFARGVGNVKVGWRGAGEKTQEVLDLILVEKLDEKRLAEVRRKALELEKSAYRISSAYARTAPLEPPAHLLASLEAEGLLNEKPAVPPMTEAQKEAAETRPKIGEEAARKIALEAVPGEITDLGIERKLGANRYVVEVVAAADGAETDVIIDMYSGEVLATEN
jgi:hypothetical protein